MSDPGPAGPATLERTYAGVLGKMTGVFLGRPVEGWSAARIAREHGAGDGWPVAAPEVVADDDLSGAFAFVRALEGGVGGPVRAVEVAEAWLDQLVEGRTTLWWGGVGSSTEHTAYRRLRDGLRPPASGSAATNGRRLAEQIGARIFADAWGLVHAHDPGAAAASARAAATVSHDGVAVDAAVLTAAAVAAAFDGNGVAAALARGFAELPGESPLHALDRDVAEALASTGDWRAAFARLAARHPYERYGGHCPLVPNQAVVLLALRAFPGDLARAVGVALRCGWDTDCNAGDVGSLLGVALGLAAFAEEPARGWRAALNDRLFVVAAEGGEVVTDALSTARTLRALGDARRVPAGAALDFAFPGATQGCAAEGGTLRAPGGAGGLEIRSSTGGRRPAPGVVRVSLATLPTPAERAVPGYALPASPTIDPGQVVRVSLAGEAGGRARCVAVTTYSGVAEGDASEAAVPAWIAGPWFDLAETPHEHAWTVSATTAPIARVGVEVAAPMGAAAAPGDAGEAAPVARLVRLSWGGPPRLELRGEALWRWRDAWFDAFDHRHPAPGGGIAFAHDRPGGWASLGGRAWDDVRASARWAPSFGSGAALFARGRGARRRLALWLDPDGWRLVEEGRAPRMLASGPRRWPADEPVRLALEARGARARAWVGDALLADVALTDATARSGAAGVACGPGTLEVHAFAVVPAADAIDDP